MRQTHKKVIPIDAKHVLKDETMVTTKLELVYLSSNYVPGGYVKCFVPFALINSQNNCMR